ncbi:TrkH family potassium uptake protein [Isoalcanivorax beigongshangi]|uniref:Trk system potassium uptake protein n=1 Tax=Isoalcanivorax beigongshangi TaxID=3238810 RepID=A0ABV4AD97_9GAMM
MHFALITKILGILLMVFSFTMVPPVVVAYLFHDGSEMAFLRSFASIFCLGLVLWLPVWRERAELQTRDGFLVVTLFWTVLGTVGSLPFLLNPALDLSITDAVFESISGLTTTGGTVLTGLDQLPKSLLFYRQQLQWLGGMGIIVLAIAILPMLGVGGMQLYKAEIPGPMKDAKLTPRIAETAKTLWFIYLVFTICCALLFRWGGMSWFDAIAHSFSTVSTGGFSTHDASMGYYDSALLDMIAAFFIFLGALSFALHFAVFRGKNPLTYWRDPEFRFFVTLIVLYVSIVSIGLFLEQRYDGDPLTILRHSVFQVMSFSTGTGLTSTDMVSWPNAVLYTLALTSFIGGCAGSTGGGMKVVRVALVFHHSLRELRRLIYPTGVFAVRFGHRAADDRVLQAVWGFVGVYIMLSVALTLAFSMTGMDLGSALATTAASLNNVGQGFGDVGSGFSHLSNGAKWIMCVAMLAGRLEVFTLLVLFTPLFWRQ